MAFNRVRTNVLGPDSQIRYLGAFRVGDVARNARSTPIEAKLGEVAGFFHPTPRVPDEKPLAPKKPNVDDLEVRFLDQVNAERLRRKQRGY